NYLPDSFLHRAGRDTSAGFLDLHAVQGTAPQLSLRFRESRWPSTEASKGPYTLKRAGGEAILTTQRFRARFATVLMILAGGATPLLAQYLGYPTAGVPKGPDGKPNMAAPAPRTADGHPDFTGMYGWVTRANCGAKCNDTQIPAEFINIASSLKGRVLPLRPEALAIQRARAAEQGSDPNVHCMPRGAPRLWTDDYYKKIIQTPAQLTLLNERNMQFRQIFLDGRPLPVDPNPSWNGYSTGHWEGDT